MFKHASMSKQQIIAHCTLHIQRTNTTCDKQQIFHQLTSIKRQLQQPAQLNIGNDQPLITKKPISTKSLICERLYYNVQSLHDQNTTEKVDVIKNEIYQLSYHITCKSII